MLATIFKGLPNVANYLDDVIVWGRTQATHDKTLKAVLQRLKDAGLQLNTSKSHFNRSSLIFLGHTVTAEDIQPDKAHITAVLHAPASTDAGKLRSFLGLLSWYIKFIPSFATVVEPLRQCICQDSEFSWSEDAQNSFETVKKLLVGGALGVDVFSVSCQVQCYFFYIKHSVTNILRNTFHTILVKL